MFGFLECIESCQDHKRRARVLGLVNEYSQLSNEKLLATIAGLEATKIESRRHIDLGTFIITFAGRTQGDGSFVLPKLGNPKVSKDGVVGTSMPRKLTFTR